MLALLGLTGAACSDSPSSNAETATTLPASETVAGFDPERYADIETALASSGSTFQQNYLNAAIGVLGNVLPGIDISYAGGGSGQGKTDLADGVVDFAATDSLIEPTGLSRFNGKVLYFPTVVAPITVPYNVKGLDKVDLDGPTLARIFSVEVTTWDDPAIAASNPDVDLPSTPITVCHRADSSGTTTNFTAFLDAAGGDDWTLGSSDKVDWASNTQAGDGNGGVAQCIKGKDGAIGYVDLSDAKSQNLTFASIRNKAGEFVQPTLEGASKAVESAEVAADLTYDPIDTAGPGVYPITSPTWVIVFAEQSDHAKGTALRGFLDFLLTDGQDPTFTASVNYAPLPLKLAERAVAQIDELEIP